MSLPVNVLTYVVCVVVVPDLIYRSQLSASLDAAFSSRTLKAPDARILETYRYRQVVGDTGREESGHPAIADQQPGATAPARPVRYVNWPVRDVGFGLV